MSCRHFRRTVGTESGAYIRCSFLAGAVFSVVIAPAVVAQDTYRDRVLADNPLFYLTLDDPDGSLTFPPENLGSAVLDATYDDTGGAGTVEFQADGLVPNQPGNQAVRFADGGFIPFVDHPDINTGNGPWEEKTISFWFNADDVSTSDKQVLYQQGGTTRGLNFYVHEGLLWVGAWNGANDDSGVSSPWVSNLDPPVGLVGGVGGNIYHSTPIESNTSYHVAMVFDGDAGGLDGTVTAYLDGSAFGAAPGAGRLFNHGNDASIGKKLNNTFYHDSTDQTGDGNPFNGTIDEWAFWNTALTPFEILAHLGIDSGPGDFNSDGSVNLDDYAILRDNFGTGTSFEEGDGNFDGQVDLNDFLEFVSLFNAANPGAAAVPEPSTWALLAIGGGFLIAAARRRLTKATVSASFAATALVVTIFAFSMQSANAQTYRERVLENDPELYLTLDNASTGGIAENLGSVGMNADYRGGVSTVAGIVPDQPGNMATQFDGIDGFLFMPDSSATNLGIHEDKTISFWFQADDVNPASPQVLFQEGGATRGINFYIAGGSLYMGAWNRADDDNGVSSPWISNLDPPEGGNIYLSTPIQANTAYHVAMVQDGDGDGLEGTLTGYLDGELFAESTGVGRLFQHTGNTSIAAATNDTFLDPDNGGTFSGEGAFFSGMMDEFANWNVALSQDLIRLHFGVEFVDGDFNRDGNTNLDDFNIMIGNFNTPGSFADGDNNLDGQVSLADFLEFRAAFNAQPGVAAVPEPSTLLLLLLGLPLWLLWQAGRRNQIRRPLVFSAALVSVFALLASTARAQVVDILWNVPGPATWNEDTNWADSAGFEAFVPSATFSEGALINNNGTAFIDEAVPDVSRLHVDNGALEIRNGGSLTVFSDGIEPQSGNARVQANGLLQFMGNGMLDVNQNFSHNGRVELPSANATFNVGGDYSMSATGVLAIPFGNGGNATVNVGGTATLNGILEADFGGQQLNFGDSFDIVTASAVNGGFSEVQMALTDPPLADGLVLAGTTSNGTASIEVQNRLFLTVDRTSGNMEISNAVGDAIELKGYSIFSENGLLAPGNFSGLSQQGMAGWDEANLRDQQLNELNLTGTETIGAGTSISLGNSHATGARPSAEDIRFQYATQDQVFDGIVKYEGPPNDLVLRVNPETGDAQIRNLSNFFDADLVGYSVFSPSDGLSTAGWESFASSGKAGEGWTEANPQSAAIAEVNLEDSQFFSGNTVINIGSPFTPGGARDLIFQYGTSDGSLLFGTVEYGDLADESTGGEFLDSDFNKDGNVNLEDFNILKGNFGSSGATMAEGDANMDGNVNLEDFNILKGQFGQSASAVPEPATCVLALLGTAVMVSVSFRRRAEPLQNV